MKAYTEYMDNISVDSALHDKIMERLVNKPIPSNRGWAALQYAGMASCAAALLLAIRLIPGLFGSSPITTEIGETSTNRTAELQTTVSASDYMHGGEQAEIAVPDIYAADAPPNLHAAGVPEMNADQPDQPSVTTERVADAGGLTLTEPAIFIEEAADISEETTVSSAIDVAQAETLIDADNTDFPIVTEMHLLIFNESEEVAFLVFDRRVDNVNALTNEQVRAIFPNLGFNIAARGFYYDDGTLIEIEAQEHGGDVQIRIAKDKLVDTVKFTPMGDVHISYVHGVPVTAYIGGSSEYQQYFYAEFMLNGFDYRVGFLDWREIGQMRMTDILNKIIVGGTAGISEFVSP